MPLPVEIRIVVVIEANRDLQFFRRLFLLSEESKQKLFKAVADMLEDSQHEVRVGAGTTLSGMIRCSPVELRERMVKQLRDKFTQMLLENPLPKKPKGQLAGLSSARTSGTSTPTPEAQRLVIVRHAAVLGLGALVQAFPYSYVSLPLSNLIDIFEPSIYANNAKPITVSRI